MCGEVSGVGFAIAIENRRAKVTGPSRRGPGRPGRPPNRGLSGLRGRKGAFSCSSAEKWAFSCSPEGRPRAAARPRPATSVCGREGQWQGARERGSEGGERGREGGSEGARERGSEGGSEGGREEASKEGREGGTDGRTEGGARERGSEGGSERARDREREQNPPHPPACGFRIRQIGTRPAGPGAESRRPP